MGAISDDDPTAGCADALAVFRRRPGRFVAGAVVVSLDVTFGGFDWRPLVERIRVSMMGCVGGSVGCVGAEARVLPTLVAVTLTFEVLAFFDRPPFASSPLLFIPALAPPPLFGRDSSEGGSKTISTD